MDAAQVVEAYQVACLAFPCWGRQPFMARQAIVKKFAVLLEEHKAEFTVVINKITISIKAYHARTGEQVNLPMVSRRYAIILTMCYLDSVSSASPMWAANAVTVCQSADVLNESTYDGGEFNQ